MLTSCDSNFSGKKFQRLYMDQVSPVERILSALLRRTVLTTINENSNYQLWAWNVFKKNHLSQMIFRTHCRKASFILSPLYLELVLRRNHNKQFSNHYNNHITTFWSYDVWEVIVGSSMWIRPQGWEQGPGILGGLQPKPFRVCFWNQIAQTWKGG